MKKLLGIVVLGLLWCNVGFAEIRLIEDEKIKAAYNYWVNTLCVDGYKFVKIQSGSNTTATVSMVQFFEERDGKSLPAKC